MRYHAQVSDKTVAYASDTGHPVVLRPGTYPVLGEMHYDVGVKVRILADNTPVLVRCYDRKIAFLMEDDPEPALSPYDEARCALDVYLASCDLSSSEIERINELIADLQRLSQPTA